MRNAPAIVASLIVAALALAAPRVRAVAAADDEARAAVSFDQSAAPLRAYADGLEARYAEGGLTAFALWMGGRSVADARARAEAAESTELADAADDAALCALLASGPTGEVADHARGLLVERLRGGASLEGADGPIVEAFSDAMTAAEADPCGLGVAVTPHHTYAPIDATIVWPATATSLGELVEGALHEGPVRDTAIADATSRAIAAVTSGHFGAPHSDAALSIDVGIALRAGPLLTGFDPPMAGLRATLDLVLTARGRSAVTWTTDVVLPIAYGIDVAAQLARSPGAETPWADVVRAMIDVLDARALDALLQYLGLAPYDVHERRITATVTEVSGRDRLDVGSECIATQRLAAEVVDGLDVSWGVDCGSQGIYGDVGGTGFARSWAATWPAGTLVLDEGTHAQDGDPALRIDLVHGVIELSDDASALSGAMHVLGTIDR